jgi:flagellar basal-body rod modification protein FlgD
MSIFGTHSPVIEGASYSDPFAPPEQKRHDEIGKDEFLMLLVEQLKNQDPLEPMDSTDFTAQMAQFSSLEQQTQMNDNLELLQDYSATLNRLSALNMIDREVEFSSQGEGTVKLTGNGDPAPLTFNLADNAQRVVVDVYNESGGRVATMELGYYDLGDHVYNWNGKDNQGGSLPSGNYTYKVRAADEMGQSVQATVDGHGIVQGVATDPQTGNTVLMLDNGKQVGIDQVVAVNNV